LYNSGEQRNHNPDFNLLKRHQWFSTRLLEG
jgi:hypothetical protein